MFRQALGFLRGHTTGDLRFAEHMRPIKYVLDRRGYLAAPVMSAMLDTMDTVLFVPEYREENMLELQVTLQPFKEEQKGGEIADRWRIYHGNPQDIYWAYLHIDAARYAQHVIDGDAMMVENTLAESGPALCRWMNSEHVDGLRRLCHNFAHVEIDDPKMVGIDPMGIDVRGRFDVVRVKAKDLFKSAEHAREVIGEMMKESRRSLT